MEAWFKQYEWLFEIVAYVIAIASIIVRLTPTLKDDDWLLPIIKLLGNIGLNKYGPKARP